MARPESTKTQIEPKCLQWARERANLSVSDLANRLKIEEAVVHDWEASGEIAFTQAEKLAEITYTPFGFLFLSEPPVETLPISDFRIIGGQAMPNPSPDLLDVIYDAQRRQNWYRQYAIANSYKPHDFVGSLSVSNDIADAANLIRSVINWDSEIRSQTANWEEALTKQIRLVEQAGILVMRSGIVGNNTHRVLRKEEFRGFAISDAYAPLIFINGVDFKAAQMFTLAHELVHIWIGASGVTNLIQTYSLDSTAERFCNAVAAELLVPKNELRSERENLHNAPDQVDRLAKHFKVSQLVILRRLHDLGYIDQDTYNQDYNKQAHRWSQKAKSSGGDFYNSLRSRLGERFSVAVVESTLEGRTSYRDAFELMGVRNNDILRKLARKIGVIA